MNPKGARPGNGMFSGTGAAIMGNSMLGSSTFDGSQKITLNLEDVVLHEQKLFNILEVSNPFIPNFERIESKDGCQRKSGVRRLVGPD